MSLTLEAPPTLFEARGAPPQVRTDGTPTLEAHLAEIWTGIAARRTVACPVCSERMEPVFGAGALPIGGRCHGCGSRLA